MFGKSFPVEFIGGSKDGEVAETKVAPEYFKFRINGAFAEIYERQNEKPPFVYVQIGYAREESWQSP